MGVDAIYKQIDDGIPYKELNPKLALEIEENRLRG